MRCKLPIGIQTFSLIREEGHCYVDKTPLIERMVDEGKYYSHWFETGTPSFLIDLMRRRGFDAPQLEGLEVTDRLLGSFDVDAMVYCYFAALGVDLIPEDTTSHGCIDLTVSHRGRIWLIEFKVNDRRRNLFLRSSRLRTRVDTIVLTSGRAITESG